MRGRAITIRGAHLLHQEGVPQPFPEQGKRDELEEPHRKDARAARSEGGRRAQQAEACDQGRVEAHGAAEMRVLEGAGHRMRHDPRAMAVLFGWLDRQRLDEG